MLEDKNLRKEKFIQMAKEASSLFKNSYPDFGKFMIILDDDDPLKAIINNDSQINRPIFPLYNDFIDRFNQEIYPKYLEFEKIGFSYFGNFKFQNKMTAFMTQVLNELRVYAKNKSIELDNIQFSSENPADRFQQLNSVLFEFESSLNTYMDTLILEYIKNYDIDITTISQFKLRYTDINRYMRTMIPKVIENID